MYPARISIRPLRFAAVLVAVVVAVAPSLGCSGDTGTDPQTGGGALLPGPDQGDTKDGTPAKSPATPSGTATAAPSGATPSTTPPGGDNTPDASAGQDAGATATGSDLGATCAQNHDCKSGECFVGGMGSYCSLLCTTANAATVCVAPFAGVCNNRGYCKK